MHDFTLIAVEGGYGTSVAVSLDILRAAAALAGRAGAPVPRWRVCSIPGGTVTLQSGIRLESSRLAVASRSDTSRWIIPGLGLNSEDDLRAVLARDDMRQLAVAIARHLARGGKVAAACSAVFLLERAGLLDRRRVTTTWWLAPLLQRTAPTCVVEADRMICVDGHIATAGAAFAQTDLMLHLVRETCGAALMDTLSRFLLIDARGSQSRYVIPAALANGDELVTQIVARVEKALPDVPSVEALAEALGVSKRTLSRRVRRATGQSTLALVQSIRLRRARLLLEQSRMSVERVASEVGYGDPTALRRLMRKVSGISPRQYRPGVSMG